MRVALAAVHAYRRLSVKSRILLFTLVLAGVLVTLVVETLAQMFASALRADAELRLQTSADYIAREVDSEMRLRMAALEPLARDMSRAIIAEPKDTLRALSQNPFAALLFSEGLAATNQDFVIVADYPPLKNRLGASVRDRDYVAALVNGAPYALGKPRMGSFTGKPTVALGVPLYDAQHTLQGLLIGIMGLKDKRVFGAIDKIDLGQTGYAMVVSPRHRLIVAASEDGRLLQPLPAQYVDPLLDRRLREGYTGQGSSTSWNGVEAITAASRIDSADWMAISGMSVAEITAPALQMRRNMYWLSGGAAAVFALCVYILLRREMAPLTAATTAMRRMAAGAEAFAPLPLAGTGEVGDLIATFNQLIAERNRSEAQLQQSETAFRTLAEIAPVGILRGDSQGDCFFVSPVFTQLTGLGSEEARGRRWLNCVHPDDQERVYAATYGTPWQDHLVLTFRIVRPDGEVRWVMGSGSKECDASGAYAGHVGTLADITELKQAQQALAEAAAQLEERVAARTHELTQANAALDKEVAERWRAQTQAVEFAQRLRDMTQRYVTAEETEKRRLGREMHDRVSSSLMAMGLSIGLMKKDLQKDKIDAALARLDDMGDLVKETMLSARAISSDLHPASLDYAGIAGAVDDYARKFSERTGLPVHVACPERDLGLAPEKETALFRIFQEALMNCAKHARASRVEVELRRENGRVRLLAEDDGVGFDPGLAGSENGAGLGLVAMRERAEFAGGRMEVDSRPGAGTRIIVEL